jgi:hypothetical protein
MGSNGFVPNNPTKMKNTKSIRYSATSPEGKIFFKNSVREKTHAVIFYRRNGWIVAEFYGSKENAMNQIAKHRLWQSRADLGEYTHDRFEIVEVVVA